MSTLQRLDLAWQAHARCVGTPVDMFFHQVLDLRASSITRERAIQHPQVREALALCSECPVKTDCLNTAMTTENGGTEQRHGIWGGLLPHERAELASKALPPFEHGTQAGWHRHRRRGIPMCGPCRAAHTAAVRDWQLRREAKRNQPEQEQTA